MARWYVRAYLRRWGAEDATRGIKHQFHLEQFLVRNWSAIRRLLWLVAWAFWWLNLWDDETFDYLREVIMNRAWRLRKKRLLPIQLDCHSSAANPASQPNTRLRHWVNSNLR
jgi:hypothetical protein